jgi:hypothetical protein
MKAYIEYTYLIDALRVRTELTDPSLTAISFYVNAGIHQHHLRESLSMRVHRTTFIVLLLYHSIEITARAGTASVCYPSPV